MLGGTQALIAESARRDDDVRARERSADRPGADRDGETGDALPRLRGLDGLRGLAVLSVLFFHNDFAWARGGFLGVSLFFTLSGYLITSLLIREAARSKRIDLLQFWGRRLRRLAPAALLALLFVCLFGAVAATPTQRLVLRGDIWAALGNVTNWRLLASGRSYAALFSDPSPLQHFWSLAIEEQFYLFFPLIVAGCATLTARRSSRSRARATVRVLAGVTVILAAASVTAQLGTGGRDRIYYATYTRAWEILAGVLLACALSRSKLPRGVARTAAVLGVPALALMLFAWSRVDLGSQGLYLGGLALFALVDVMVVFAAIVPGPVRALCSWRPLVWTGLVSYGLYLFHWPVYLWLDTARTSLVGWPLFAVRVGATTALAIASFFLVELPIRRGTRLHSWRAPVAWVAGIAVVALVAPLAIRGPRANQVITASDFARADRLVQAARAHQPTTRATSIAAAPVAADAPVPTPLSVYVVGDSTGAMLAGALALLQRDSGQVLVRSAATATCGFVRVDELRWADGSAGAPKPACANQPNTWRADLAQWKPNAILLVSGPPNTSSFRRADVDGDAWTNIAEPTGRVTVEQGMNDTVDALHQAAPGVPLLWLTAPYTERLRVSEGDVGDSGSIPSRIDAYNQLIDTIARTRPGVVKVPWADYFDQLPLDADSALRPDGFHTDVDALERVVRDWGWTRIVDAYRAATKSGSAGQPDVRLADEAIQALVLSVYR